MTLIPVFAHAQWVDRQGRPLAQTESLKSSGDFGVQLVLTADGKAFRESWNASAAPPRLRSTQAVQRGAALSAMVIFHGCAAGPAGHCDADLSYSILQPDGKTIPAGTGPLWTGKPAAGRLLLADADITVSFDENDVQGTYKILAKATDKVSGRQIEVSAPFTLK